MSDKIWTVIPAAGIGTRMRRDIPKQYLQINGRCVLDYALETFCQHAQVEGVVVALAKDDPWWSTLELAGHKKVSTCEGGQERCHSVLNGLDKLLQSGAPSDWVMVHDAARPCLRREDIDSLIDEVSTGQEGGILAIPVRDTMKRGDTDRRVQETVDRSQLWHALTPQMFRLGALRAAIDGALADGELVTDEASAMERAGAQVRLVEGHVDNIKITHPQDLLLANLYLSGQEDSQCE